MATRVITNVGKPLQDAGGRGLAGVVIDFTLVDAQRKTLDVVWNVDGSRIALSTVRAVTNEDGEFSVSLIPNDQLTEETAYLCVAKGLGSPFFSTLESGVTPKQWHDFFLQGNP